MEEDYVKRVNDLRSSLDKATARKEDRENELDLLKKEYLSLVENIKQTFGCDPTDLKTLITTKSEKVEQLLTDAETKLSEITDNIGAN
jgi:hypothetical protein